MRYILKDTIFLNEKPIHICVLYVFSILIDHLCCFILFFYFIIIVGLFYFLLKIYIYIWLSEVTDFSV